MSIEAQGAERAILAILFKYPNEYFKINDVLTEADFVNLGASMIFSIIKELILSGDDVKIDQHIIFSEAERKNIQGFLHHTLNGELIEAIDGMHVKASNLGRYVSDVKQAAIKRALINTCEDLKDDIEEYVGNSIDLRNMVENQILDSLRDMDSEENDIINLSEGFEETIDIYADSEGHIGVDIGLPRWQKDVGYIRNGAITGIFAYTKVGKSQLAMWSAFKTAICNRLPCLYLDTELQRRQQQMRLCGIMSGIHYSEIESGIWKNSHRQIAKIREVCANIRHAPIFYKNIAGRSVHGVIPTIRKFVYKEMGGPVVGDTSKGLVIYDYIKLMDMTDMSSRIQEYQLIGLLMSGLHDCAGHLNIPIITLGQLNKQKDIGIQRIIENVDSATILRPKEPEELQEDGIHRGTHVLEAKWARNGPGHNFNEWVNIHFDRSCGQFKEDKRNSEISTTVKMLKEKLIEQDADGLIPDEQKRTQST